MVAWTVTSWRLAFQTMVISSLGPWSFHPHATRRTIAKRICGCQPRLMRKSRRSNGVQVSSRSVGEFSDSQSFACQLSDAGHRASSEGPALRIVRIGFLACAQNHIFSVDACLIRISYGFQFKAARPFSTKQHVFPKRKRAASAGLDRHWHHTFRPLCEARHVFVDGKGMVRRYR
jgi:hypothetical protein